MGIWGTDISVYIVNNDATRLAGGTGGAVLFVYILSTLIDENIILGVCLQSIDKEVISVNLNLCISS